MEKTTGITYDDHLLLDKEKNYYFRNAALLNNCLIIPKRKATHEELAILHKTDYVNAIANFSPSNKIDEHSITNFHLPVLEAEEIETAYYSAGCSLDLISAILESKVNNGLALIRPLGQFATREKGGEINLFNNIALAAEYARVNYKLKRIVILDWGVHHGHGLQKIFYENSEILNISVHYYLHGLSFPYNHEADHLFVGKHDGEGYNVNIPINQHSVTHGDYIAILYNVILPIITEFSPELIITILCFNSFELDDFEPLEASFYTHLIYPLLGYAGGKVCIFLEGGLSSTLPPEDVDLYLSVLLGNPCSEIKATEAPCESVITTILNVKSSLHDYWGSLRISTTEEGGKSQFTPIFEFKGSAESLNKIKEFSLFRPTLLLSSILDLARFWNKKEEYYFVHSKQRTALAYDPDMQKHIQEIDDDGNALILRLHMEKPDRVEVIFNKLTELGLVEDCKQVNRRMATYEELALIHKPEYIDLIASSENATSIKMAEVQRKSHLNYICSSTYASSRLAVGMLLEVVDEVVSQSVLNGMAIIRPPGHHAETAHGSGGCIFNNIGIAAKYALTKHQLKRVLILDWDIHHGNGTQGLFYDDPRVLYISIHRYDNGTCFPGPKGGDTEKSGADYGIGYNINIGWEDTINWPKGNADYLGAMFNIVLPVAYEFNPQLVLVSCGFDSGKGDAIGLCSITPDGYGLLTHLIGSVAKGKVILALEGGYNYNTLQVSAAECVRSLLRVPFKSTKPDEFPSKNAIKLYNEVIGIHKIFWKSLAFDITIPWSHFKHKEPERETISFETVTSCSHMELITPFSEAFKVKKNQKCCICGMNGPELCLTCHKYFCNNSAKHHDQIHSMQFGHPYFFSSIHHTFWCSGCLSTASNPTLLEIKDSIV